MRLPLQTNLYSATAAAVVQSRLHETCSVYYFASFYVRQNVLCSLVLAPSHENPGDATDRFRMSWWSEDVESFGELYMRVFLSGMCPRRCYGMATGCVACLYLSAEYWRSSTAMVCINRMHPAILSTGSVEFLPHDAYATHVHSAVYATARCPSVRCFIETAG